MSNGLYPPTNSQSKSDLLSHKNAIKYIAKDTVLPPHIKQITTEVFFRDRTIRTIVFPKALETIGARAFFRCASVKEIHLPEKVTSIGVSAFAECPALTAVTLPVELRVLKDDMFNNDRTLKNCSVSGKLQTGINPVRCVFLNASPWNPLFFRTVFWKSEAGHFTVVKN